MQSPEPPSNQAGMPPQDVGALSLAVKVNSEDAPTVRLPHSAPNRTAPMNGWSCLLAHSSESEKILEMPHKTYGFGLNCCPYHAAMKLSSNEERSSLLLARQNGERMEVVWPLP